MRWSGKTIRANYIQTLFTGETDVKTIYLLCDLRERSNII